MLIPNFALPIFEPANFQALLHTRFPLVDQPLSLDKVTLSVRFHRLNLAKACQWLTGKPWISMERTDHNWRIFIHGELLFRSIFVSHCLRMIVFDMWKQGVFRAMPEDEPYISEIEPSDYLFTFVTISQVEIAFDFRRDQVPESLFCRDYTLYSDDYVPGSDEEDEDSSRRGQHSGFYAYNRIDSLKAKNQHSHSRIDLLKYAYRAEFLLTSRRCPYLNLENLEGHSHQIVERFLPYLQAFVSSPDFPRAFRVSGLDNPHQEIADLLFNYVFPRELNCQLKLTKVWNTEVKFLLSMLRHWN